MVFMLILHFILFARRGHRQSAELGLIVVGDVGRGRRECWSIKIAHITSATAGTLSHQ